MQSIPALILLAAALLGAAVRAEAPASAPAPEAALPDGLYAAVRTVRGTITAELRPDWAPLAVANFVGLAEGTIPIEGRAAGTRYFDGLTFHRVVPGFVVQGGDPLGTGEGGPGYEFADEFTPHARHAAVGTLAMANSGPNTNGSQFYFTLSPVNRLNYKHTVFGRVVRGLDVLARIEPGDAMQEVRIERVGAAALAYRVDAARFAQWRAEARGIPPRATTLPPLFENAGNVEVPDFFPGWINEKLHHYATVRGVAIWVRTVAEVGAESDGATALFQSLAAGGAPAALLLLEAKPQRWTLRMNDAARARLGAAAKEAAGLAALEERVFAPAREQLQAGNARRSIDAAITALIEELDRADGGVSGE